MKTLTLPARTTDLQWFPTLMYHRVVPSVDWPDPLRLCVSVAEFEWQLRYLIEHGYRIVSMEDALTVAANAHTPVLKQVVLTFDDGYMDFYTCALPVLQKLGLPSTVFLVSRLVGGSNEWDQGQAEMTSLMGPAEIAEAKRAGVTFGSHSLTHPRLAHLNRPDIEKEVFESKTALEQMLQSEVRLFCYPYGSSSPVVESIVAEAGYVAACGIEQRNHGLHNVSRIDAVRSGGRRLRWWFHVSGNYYRLRKRAAAARGNRP